MSSTRQFSEFNARLREFISVSSSGAVGGPAAEAGFEALAWELFELQFEANEVYGQLCRARRLSPQTVEHWSQIPALPTSAFKELVVSCLPAEQRTALFHSSGTTQQQPSRHFHSEESLAIYEASLLPWFYRHVLRTDSAKSTGSAPGQTQSRGAASCAQGPGSAPSPASGQRERMLILAPPKVQAPHSSLVHMFDTVCREFGAAGSVFAGSAAEDETWVLNFEQAHAALRSAENTGRPLVLLGTAFSFVHLLDELARHDLSFRLPPGSRVMETGGYKGRSRQVPKHQLHALVARRLGIPLTHIVSEYGMSELGSQAYDRRAGADSSGPAAPDLAIRVSGVVPPPSNATRRFRFPPWARALIISPETGREVSEGQTGLIRVFDLANIYSAMAIQTEDLAVRHADGFVVIGRAAPAEPRGCSLLAVDNN